jgi:signal transduction histidine kinase
MRVLVVEEDPAVAELIRRAVGSGSVVVAEHAVAFAQAFGSTYDAAVVALRLSWGAGIAVREALMTHHSDCRVVLLCDPGDLGLVPAGMATLPRTAAGLGELCRILRPQQVVAPDARWIHDLREPLRTIHRYATELLHETVDPQAKEKLTVIHDAVDQVRDHLRGVVSEPEHADLEKILEQAIAALAALLDEHGAVVQHDPFPEIAAPSAVVRQVLQNLLENACKHGGNKIAVRAVRDGSVVRISVSDNGPGVSEAEAGRIFQMFERGRSGAPGMGMGLALCRQALEKVGGKIWVEPPSGAGATFTFLVAAPPARLRAV